MPQQIDSATPAPGGGSRHACRWGAIQLWVPPSRRPDAHVGEAVPYRACACGETVWGTRVYSADVLASLAAEAGPKAGA